ncbi:hypothetical protein BV20DRAFT_158279 [Pilatotrama ljubarskyi]|nr:hypothetical protein BV20DRAFT_158279 [Pilatotrama ljubarskyi]
MAEGGVADSALARSHPSGEHSQDTILATSTPGLADATVSIGAFADELLDSYSDDELLNHISHALPLVTTKEQAVRLLSPNLVAKRIGGFPDEEALDEVCAMQRARAAGVKTPALRRLVPVDDEGTYYILVDRVIGPTLEQAWRNLGLWGTIRAALQLRANLRLLHSITSQTTGGMHSGRTRCIWLDDQHGPARHASPLTFTNYLNWWLVDCRPTQLTPQPHLVLEPAKEHVFVHQDLAPRNMILDPQGVLWIVDWGHAGFYPTYMEYLGMKPQGHDMPWLFDHTWGAWWGRVRWSIFRWIAVGSFYRYRKAWQACATVSFRTQRYRLDKTPYSDTL